MAFPRLIAIAACDERGLIGNKGKLPWHFPADLEHFYRSTEGQVLIMGYNTFLTLPQRAFANRTCIVFTKNHKIDPSIAHSVASLDDLRNLYASHPNLLQKTNFVVGGAALFSLFFSKHLIAEAVITHIHGQYEGDAYFPLHAISGWHQKIVFKNQDFTIAHYKP